MTRVTPLALGASLLLLTADPLAGGHVLAEVLGAWLSAPRPCASGRPCMPDLGLKTPEVALAVFLNASAEETVATVR